MKDVARLAGVSLWTVSRAFSDPAKLTSATRQRVLVAASALGYSGPDPIARSLRSGRTGIVALVGPGGVVPLLGDPIGVLVGRGLAEGLERAGSSLLLAAAADGSAADGWALLREAAGARPAPKGPCVAIDADPPAGMAAVGADVAAGAGAAAAHLRALGHRRLTVITWPGAGARLTGARDGWGAAGPMEVLVVGAEEGSPAPAAARVRTERLLGPTRADGEVAGRIALGRDPRPTAVLALSDRLALGVLEAAQVLGVAVPRDLSLVGVDDVPGAEEAGLTTVFVPYRPLGQLAAVTLAALIDGSEPPPAVLPTSLVLRGTSGPAPA